jgi:LemA protein
VLLMAVTSYNRFVRQRNLVAESWRQIDVELVRRHDLVPSLVAVVQAYAAHERALFEHGSPRACAT